MEATQLLQLWTDKLYSKRNRSKSEMCESLLLWLETVCIPRCNCSHQKYPDIQVLLRWVKNLQSLPQIQSLKEPRSQEILSFTNGDMEKRHFFIYWRSFGVFMYKHHAYTQSNIVIMWVLGIMFLTSKAEEESVSSLGGKAVYHLCLFLWAQGWLDGAHQHLAQISTYSVQSHVQIFSGNTLTDTSRIMLYQVTGYSLIQSSWHWKLSLQVYPLWIWHLYTPWTIPNFQMTTTRR